MATAESLLNEYGATDTVLTIDLNTRVITIPKTITNLGVESDDDVKRLYFKMLKQYGEFDLSEFEVRINYTNANKDDDFYPVEDVVVTDDGYMIFSWLVGRFACVVRGPVEFSLCLKKMDADNVVIKEFNSTTTTLPVLPGKETSEAVYQQYPDVIEYILANMGEADSAVVDGTLSIAGAAADAKATGDALSDRVKTVNGNAPDENGNVVIDTAPITYGTEDLTAGTSPLSTGTLYLVYE